MKYSELEVAMMRSMHRMKNIHFWDMCSGMNRGEAILMNTLCHDRNACEPMALSELTEKIQMHAAAMSRIMKGLEAKGLIKRSIDPDNHRNILVNVTDDGLALDRGNTRRIHTYWQNVLGKISEEDQETMLRIWNEVMDNMEAELEEEKKQENKQDKKSKQEDCNL